MAEVVGVVFAIIVYYRKPKQREDRPETSGPDGGLAQFGTWLRGVTGTW